MVTCDPRISGPFCATPLCAEYVVGAVSAIVAEPVLDGSILLPAVIVVLVPVAGAVRFPFASIDPLLADHVTDSSKLPVPVTFAEHLFVALFSIDVEMQETVTPEIVVSVSVAVPDFEESCLLVAVIVALLAVFGAVNKPLWSMVPAVADHVTAELKLPVPFTVGLH
jgi:hypothetical protein